MKNSAYATIIYFFLTLIYKLFADADKLEHTNIYWLYTSIIFIIIFENMQKNAILKIYKRIFQCAAWYWGLMAVLHFICIFDISLYRYLNSANKFSVGAVFIFMIFIYLFHSLIKIKNDTKSER